VRTGAHALSLLSNPLNAHVLRALESEPKPLGELRPLMGSPPQTTMRTHLRTLVAAGILERQQEPGFPGAVTYQLGGSGRRLLPVAVTLQRWLADSPGEFFSLGSPTAKSMIKALVDGWNCGVVRALAARPLALTELSRVVTGLTYPSLERRLVAMRLAGQIERCESGGRGTPYRVTDWLRRAVAPLMASIRWERGCLREETAPMKRIDIESIFLLAVPLLRLGEDVSGTCRLAVEHGRSGEAKQVSGVAVEVVEGRIFSCSSKLEGRTEGWATGASSAWMHALIDHDEDSLEIGGDGRLARELVQGLHFELFAGSPDSQRNTLAEASSFP